MGGEIAVIGAAVGALAANGIIAIAFRSEVLTRRASAHGCQVYWAPGDFTNSSVVTAVRQFRHEMDRSFLHNLARRTRASDRIQYRRCS